MSGDRLSLGEDPRPASTDTDYGAFASDVHSQFGEDGVIDVLLSRLDARDRWCVEFGAWNGLVASNTATLIEAGYSAVLIEGEPEKYSDLELLHVHNETVTTLRAMVGWEGPDRLDALLRATPIPADFDLLSIDIDGNDYHVWSAVQEYRPKLVVIEFNPTIPNGIEFVQPPDPTIHRGSSISSLATLASSKGYQLAATTEANAFFIRDDLYGDLGIDDSSVEALRTDRSWQTTIFFGYDGVAILRGGKGLHWHGLEIPKQKRMVPRAFARFPGDFGRSRAIALTCWRRLQYLRRMMRSRRAGG